MATTISRTDQDIQRDILDEIAWEPRLRPHEIGVTVYEGVVTLTGWADSYAKKWAAERAAHRLPRVRAVANNIEVRVPSSAARTDADVAIAASRALEWDAFVPIRSIDVTVSNGWVVLRGQVEWEYQRRAAEQAVGRLTSVQGVTNGISVRPRTRPAPDELRHRITSALVRTVEADAEAITIEVRDDVVVLRGSVRSPLERAEAERVAWSAPGVAAVHNQITVRP